MHHALVADDHEVTRRGIHLLLSDVFAGVEVTEAGDGATVLRRLPERAWDLLVLDLVMPGMPTVELIRKIRDAGVLAPILVVTALLEQGSVPELFAAGASGFIQKHRTARDMEEAVRCVFSGARYLHPSTALELADRLSAPPPVQQVLSERELQVFRCLAQGKSIKATAVELSIGAKTVATYVARIRVKTGLKTPREMARHAVDEGLVTAP